LDRDSGVLWMSSHKAVSHSAFWGHLQREGIGPSLELPLQLSYPMILQGSVCVLSMSSEVYHLTVDLELGLGECHAVLCVCCDMAQCGLHSIKSGQ
jgi:hypothetical protein